MIPHRDNFVNRHRRPPTTSCLRHEERAVSEVLGVVMLLAMVITIMGGVWVFLNPYLSDFEDNTNWNSATGLADRIEDRIEVAGNAPDGTGYRNTLAIQSTSIRPVQNVEQWTVAADLTDRDVVQLRHVSETTVAVLSANETARSIRVESPGVVFTDEITASHLEVFITHNASASHWMIITVYDADDTPLHRQVMISLSGLQVTTSLGQGEHQIVLMNNARAERFPNGAWDVSKMPLVEFDRMANDELRLSMLLTDVITNERVIDTMVLANDGNIVVLGGLVKDKVLDTSQGVPVLSSIPLLGRLFRNDSVTVTKNNLLVFIRPSIIRNDEDLAGATAEKYRYIREQQMERRERGLMFLDDGNLPVLPTWEEQIQQLPEVPESATGEG